MKTLLIAIPIIVLLELAGTASATSPQPEEVRPGAKETVCTAHVIYSPDTEKGIEKGSMSTNFSFDASVSRKAVLDKVNEHIAGKLTETNVSEFSLECKFAK